MFQTFDAKTTPATGAARLAALREAMRAAGVDGFLVPRADAFQGENVAPRDERLAWLTGFTGSAGLCAALAERAAVFIDGRYTLQVRDQVDLAVFTPVAIHETAPAEWLAGAMAQGQVLAYDPWLHGREELGRLAERLTPLGVTLRAVENLVDTVWPDQPAPPAAPLRVHPDALAGETHGAKRARLGAELAAAEAEAALITLPDSIAWLLNIRGGDIARSPYAHAFALLGADGRVSLFTDPAKLGAEVAAHLGNEVDVQPWSALEPALTGFAGRRVTLDRATAPARVADLLEAAGAAILWRADPCVAPKARKTAAELDGMRSAQARDSVALARFLCWLDGAAPQGGLTEIDVVRRLEAFRAEAGGLTDISFETISGAGPNGAIVHYRVTEATNRTIQPGELLLVDSGAQYAEGTTDITRTMATGVVGVEEAWAFTLVLKGMIALSRARFPQGVAGRDLDALARVALWRAGLDYDHGTGHGVGACLGVHEGPQAISRRNMVPLEAGMVLSNEPGFYREGAFGIRIENLLAVTPAEIPEGGTRKMLGFETLTFVPIDRRLIRPDMLDAAERVWLDAYHAEVLARVRPRLDAETAGWLDEACAPL
ncbi:aminopeptidase P family protein [Paroceanicella profunda]|uniref:Aminopeptidase P family protein n=1 Tax=Paroceanicella profunda TaxID=2579971 RepID=A0A5B8FVI7_9RHOB|nr:aminopeptidase P family protein [Paroceanicella profunda]QDL91374.1 aminopeptidase P family protein [Paroceanicella profunda]